MFVAVFLAGVGFFNLASELVGLVLTQAGANAITHVERRFAAPKTHVVHNLPRSSCRKSRAHNGASITWMVGTSSATTDRPTRSGGTHSSEAPKRNIILCLANSDVGKSAHWLGVNRSSTHRPDDLRESGPRVGARSTPTRLHRHLTGAAIRRVLKNSPQFKGESSVRMRNSTRAIANFAGTAMSAAWSRERPAITNS